MATLLRPPPSIIKTNQKNKSYFTLHKHVNSVMAWETTATSKMAVVAFKNRDDIQTMGSMIEYHHRATHEWPDFREMTFMKGPHQKPLEILDIYQWSDVDELKMYCAKYYFDLILVNAISDSFNIQGEALTLEVSPENHVPYLEELIVF